MFSEYVNKRNNSIEDLLAIMKILRGEGGCPWDREQTHESIRQNMIEEAYEAVDAIDCNNPGMLCEELGDVLLQVVFHCQMSNEDGQFGFSEVVDGICRKLIERHPHIFGEVRAETSDEVLKNWDAIKQKSKNQNTVTDTLKAVPKAFPALMRAQKVLKRASKAEFEHPSYESSPEKKIPLICSKLSSGERDADKLAGDLLLYAVSLVRSRGLDAEECLAAATDRYIGEFSMVETDLKPGK